MIGEKCYVFAVKPGSDADAKGLGVGSLVLSVDGTMPTRANLWKMRYFYYSLRPQPGMQLVVQGGDSQQHQLTVRAQVRQGQRVHDLTGGSQSDYWKLIREAEGEGQLNRQRTIQIGKDLIIWKMPQWDMSRRQVSNMMKKVRKAKALILDLRGNGGGLVSTLEWLTGHFFDHDVKMADRKGRKKMKPMMAKTRGNRMFNGKLVVLIDSDSASASELFARVVQLENRGTVIGDRSAGAVMQSKHYGHQAGVNRVMFYGASITNADLIMSDGKSLEHIGVTPDELILPTMQDLMDGRDPVMARAATLVGVEMDSKESGALFPIEWRK